MKPGTKVFVNMLDGRKLQATLCRIEDTVAGRKVVALSGDLLVRVSAEQVLQKIK